MFHWGACERTWRGVKRVKSGQKSHLGPKQTKMRSIIYVSSTKERARLHREHKLARDGESKFDMEDLSFNVGLLKYGVDVEELQRKTPKRIVRVYVEDWEIEARHKKSDDCKEMIANKYGGIRFYDPDCSDILEVFGGKECYWQNRPIRRGRRGGGMCWSMILRRIRSGGKICNPLIWKLCTKE